MRYYFDTSIWLDLFESRDEWHLSKGKIAAALMQKIITRGERIVYSDAIVQELGKLGYGFFELERKFSDFLPLLLFAEYSLRQMAHAREIAKRREVPLFDVLHALIAKEHNAILVSRDRDFRQLSDIVTCRSPEEVM